MPARFLKTAYEPPHNGLVEMRKRGLPWLAASSILIIFVLVGSVSYLFMREQQRGNQILNGAPNRTESSDKQALITPPPTFPEELEPTEVHPPNPLEFGSAEDEETSQRAEATRGTDDVGPASGEGTSAIPWLDDTPSEEGVAEIDREEEDVETSITAPIVLDDASSEEDEEPMRGDYPDDFHRRTTTTDAPSTTPPLTTPSADFSTTSPSAVSTTPSTPSSTSTTTAATPSPTSSVQSSTTTLTPSLRTPLLPVSEFSRAAITATNEICADIARNVLMSGGNAVDAAIAGAFCLGGVEPHAAGLGGSAVMTVYQKATGRCEVVDGREAAPARVDTEAWASNPRAREHGYQSIGVPGTLHALLSAYRRFRSGRMEWAALVQPTIQLVESGFPVSQSLADAVAYRAAEINETAGMRDIFLPNGVPLTSGDVSKDVRLAETLRKIATSRDPAHLFYRGELAERIVHEIRAKGGFISKSDLVLFSSSVEDALSVEMTSMTLADAQSTNAVSRLCGPPPPSSFAALQTGLRLIEALNISSIEEELFSHYLLEATKIALNLKEQLGDSSNADLLANLTSPAFIDALSADISETSGARLQSTINDVTSAHINVIDEQGNAVAITMGMNRPFGSLRRSESLGFVWNNAMAAFNMESGHANALHPKKRPMTVAMPFVLVDKESGEVNLVGGATGDSSSFSALLSTLTRLIIRGEHLDEAIAAARIDATSGAFESGALPLVRALSARGHSLAPALGANGAATSLLQRSRRGRLLAACDPRARLARCARGV